MPRANDYRKGKESPQLKEKMNSDSTSNHRSKKTVSGDDGFQTVNGSHLKNDPQLPNTQQNRSRRPNSISQMSTPKFDLQYGGEDKVKVPEDSKEPAGTQPANAGPEKTAYAGPEKTANAGPEKTANAGPEKTANAGPDKTTRRPNLDFSTVRNSGGEESHRSTRSPVILPDIIETLEDDGKDKGFRMFLQRKRNPPQV